MFLLLFLLLFCLNLPPLTVQMPEAGNETKTANATKAPPAAKLPPMNANGTLNLLLPSEDGVEMVYRALVGIVGLVDDDNDKAMTKAEVDLFMGKLEKELQQRDRSGTSLMTNEEPVLIEPVTLLVALGIFVAEAVAGAAIGYGVEKGLDKVFAPGSDSLPNGFGRVCGQVWLANTIDSKKDFKSCSRQISTDLRCLTYNTNKRLCLYKIPGFDDKSEKVCAIVEDRQRPGRLTPVASVCTDDKDGKECTSLSRKYGWGEKLCVITETETTQWCREAREDKQQARKNIRGGLYMLIKIGDSKGAELFDFVGSKGDGKLTHEEIGDAVLSHKKKKVLKIALDYMKCGVEGLRYFDGKLPKLGANSTLAAEGQQQLRGKKP